MSLKANKLEISFKTEIDIEGISLDKDKSKVKAFIENQFEALSITEIDVQKVWKKVAHVNVTSNASEIIKKAGKSASGRLSRQFTTGSFAEEEKIIERQKGEIMEFVEIFEIFRNKLKEQEGLADLGQLLDRVEAGTNGLYSKIADLQNEMKQSKETFLIIQNDLMESMKGTIESLDHEKTALFDELQQFKDKHTMLEKENQDIKEQLLVKAPMEELDTTKATSNVVESDEEDELYIAPTKPPTPPENMAEPPLKIPESPPGILKSKTTLNPTMGSNQVLLQKIEELEKDLDRCKMIHVEEMEDIHDKDSRLSISLLEFKEKCKKLELQLEGEGDYKTVRARLEAELKELKNQNSDMELTIKKLQKHIMKKEKKTKPIIAEWESNKSKLELLEGERVKMVEELQTKNLKLQDLQSEIGQYSTSMEQTNARLLHFQQDMEEVKISNAKLQEENITLKNELLSFKANHGERSEQVNLLVIQVSEKEQELEAKKRENDDLVGDLGAIETQLSLIQMKLDHDEKLIEENEVQIRSLEENNMGTHGKLEEAEKSIAELKVNIEKLNIVVEEKEERIELISFNKEKMEQMVMSANEQERCFKESNVKLSAESSKSKLEVQRLTEILEERDGVITEHVAVIEKKNIEITAYKSSFPTLESQIKQSEEKRQDVEQELQIAKLEEEEKGIEYKKQIEELRQEIEEKESENESLLSAVRLLEGGSEGEVESGEEDNGNGRKKSGSQGALVYSLKTEVTEANKRYDELMKEYKDLDTAFQILHTDREEVGKQYLLFKLEVDRLKRVVEAKDVGGLGGGKGTTKHTKHSEEAEFATYKRSASVFGFSKTPIPEELVSLRGDKKELNKQLKTCRQNEVALINKIGKLEKEKLDFVEEINALTEEVRMLRAGTDQLRETHKRTEAAILTQLDEDESKLSYLQQELKFKDEKLVQESIFIEKLKRDIKTRDEFMKELRVRKHTGGAEDAPPPEPNANADILKDMMSKLVLSESQLRNELEQKVLEIEGLNAEIDTLNKATTGALPHKDSFSNSLERPPMMGELEYKREQELVAQLIIVHTVLCKIYEHKLIRLGGKLKTLEGYKGMGKLREERGEWVSKCKGDLHFAFINGFSPDTHADVIWEAVLAQVDGDIQLEDVFLVESEECQTLLEEGKNKIIHFEGRRNEINMMLQHL